MLLKQNESRLSYCCDINLYFEDGSEKHITIKEQDRLKITHRSNGSIYVDTGLLTDITPIIHTDIQGMYSYGCNCGYGNQPTALLSLDISREYESNIRSIMIGDILDIVKLDSKEGMLVANPDNLDEIMANAKAGDTIQLQEDIYSNDIIITKPLILKGYSGSNIGTVITGLVKVTSSDVTIMGCTFNADKTYADTDRLLEVTCNGSFTFTNNTVVVTTDTIRTAILINAKGVVNISNNVFVDTKNGAIYNTIEVGLNDLYPISSGSKFNGNTFIGKIKHNHLSMYTFENNADIDVSGNTFKYSANALRISNITSSTVNFTMYNNNYNSTDISNNHQYAGFIVFQDYAPKGSVMDFTKMSLYISNLIGPDGNRMLGNKLGTIDQIYYVYDDQDGLITGTNQPNVTLA